MARGRSGGGSGAAVLGVLLIVGLIVKFIWWIVGAAALVGLFFAVRALARYIDERRAVAARKAEELAYRADRENRWARRGDNRGVYGVEGAELMRNIAPELPDMPDEGLGDDVEIAGIVTSAQGLSELIAARTPGWRWAAFASVLVQRQAAVQSRLRDCRLGFAPGRSMRVQTGAEVARFVTSAMEDLVKLTEQVESFMLTTAFMEVFGRPGDEASADADGIVQVANRLMDYHDRLLTVAERCRDVDAPSSYSTLMRDCRQLTIIPLDGYSTFIDDFVEFIGQMPDMVRYGRGTVEADPILLHMSVDDQLLKRITKQIRVAARAG